MKSKFLYVIAAGAIAFGLYSLPTDLDASATQTEMASSPSYTRLLDSSQEMMRPQEDPDAAEANGDEAALVWNPISASLTSGCLLSGCLGSLCTQSGCLGSGCEVSGCVGSLCILSACAGSACVGSGCFGSVCAGSGCFGSVCAGQCKTKVRAVEGVSEYSTQSKVASALRVGSWWETLTAADGEGSHRHTT
ncbi:MAG: hypothetical protein AAF628_12890 [Planctomycetota bacterium]